MQERILCELLWCSTIDLLRRTPQSSLLPFTVAVIFFDHNHVHSLQNFVKSRNLTIYSFTFTYVSGDCRKLSFPPYLFFANKRLVNYVIKTEQVPDMDTCEMLCFNEHNCVSCNFENNVRSDDGTHQCELNN